MIDLFIAILISSARLVSQTSSISKRTKHNQKRLAEYQETSVHGSLLFFPLLFIKIDK
jgi:hypothetical protein